MTKTGNAGAGGTVKSDIGKRLDKLEQAAAATREPAGELPVIVLTWEENETPATRAAERAARRQWARAGADVRAARVVVTWGDDETQP